MRKKAASLLRSLADKLDPPQRAEYKPPDARWQPAQLAVGPDWVTTSMPKPDRAAYMDPDKYGWDHVPRWIGGFYL